MYHNKESKGAKARRPTFLYEDQPVRAAGVLFYTIIDNQVELLMYNDDYNYYQDFGGKTSLDDFNYENTAFRECEEETNRIITQKMLVEQYTNNLNIFKTLYNNKYVVFCIRLDNYFINNMDLNNTSIFGDLEIFDNIPRTVHWIKFKDIDDYNIHARLKFNDFYDFFNKLQPNSTKYRFYYVANTKDKQGNKVTLENRAQTKVCNNIDDHELLKVFKNKVISHNKLQNNAFIKINNINKWTGQNWVTVFIEQYWPEI